MMYGYGTGGWWMMLMPVLWIAITALIVWVVIRLIQANGGGRVEGHRETPLEILDRRYAQGEIDDAAYATARARLTGHAPSTP